MSRMSILIVHFKLGYRVSVFISAGKYFHHFYQKLSDTKINPTKFILQINTVAQPENENNSDEKLLVY